MGDMISIERPDGKTCPGYEAKPAGGGPGLVVIQEWWGLNDQIKKMANRFAEAGFHAVVPDLYRGKLATDADEAGHMMGNLDFPDAATQDVRGVLTYLKKTSGKAGVTGFCMGGALTILSGIHVSEMDAGVCFYGIPPAEAGDPGSIKVPLMCHFATVDDWCNKEAVDGLEAKLKEGKVNYELFRYEGAQHAFMNEARPEVFDAAVAKQAWDRTIPFLKKHLA